MTEIEIQRPETPGELGALKVGDIVEIDYRFSGGINQRRSLPLVNYLGGDGSAEFVRRDLDDEKTMRSYSILLSRIRVEENVLILGEEECVGYFVFKDQNRIGKLDKIGL